MNVVNNSLHARLRGETVVEGDTSRTEDYQDYQLKIV